MLHEAPGRAVFAGSRATSETSYIRINGGQYPARRRPDKEIKQAKRWMRLALVRGIEKI
jgi:hypothetical protein